MKVLLEKIRNILRSRRTRQMLTRFVSVAAALVVFVTTYALVLPAITMEQNASCGIPEHQHTDACYEEQLVCGLSESAGHHHEASCYEKFLICGLEAHVHSPECYQQDSSVYDTGVSVTESYAAGEEGMGGAAAEESAEEESASAQAGTEESGAEEAVPKGHGEGGADTEKSDTEKSDTEKSAAEEAVPGEADPEEYASGEAAPGETVSEENGTGETASGESAAVGETAPETDGAVALAEKFSQATAPKLCFLGVRDASDRCHPAFLSSFVRTLTDILRCLTKCSVRWFDLPKIIRFFSKGTGVNRSSLTGSYDAVC